MNRIVTCSSSKLRRFSIDQFSNQILADKTVGNSNADDRVVLQTRKKWNWHFGNEIEPARRGRGCPVHRLAGREFVKLKLYVERISGNRNGNIRRWIRATLLQTSKPINRLLLFLNVGKLRQPIMYRGAETDSSIQVGSYITITWNFIQNSYHFEKWFTWMDLVSRDWLNVEYFSKFWFYQKKKKKNHWHCTEILTYGFVTPFSK